MAKPAPVNVVVSHAEKTQDPVWKKSTGARSIVCSLEEFGVDVVFGTPGGIALPAYGPIFQSDKPRHILIRREQGTGHTIEGYTLATGKVGVCIATSSSGVTNLMTSFLDTHMDSVPTVAIMSQAGANAIGSDAFQKAGIVDIMIPVIKYSFLVMSAEEIPARIAETFHLASAGRPGPVLVDATKSAQVEEADFMWPPEMDPPGHHPVVKPNAR